MSDDGRSREEMRIDSPQLMLISLAL
jgi:hypothetical protein